MIFDPLIAIPIIIPFLIVLLIIPFWIRKTKEIGLVWGDMNKLKKKDVSGSGGIIVLLSFIIGIFFYVAYNVFIHNMTDGFLVSIFALLTSMFFLSLIGFVDDIFGWQRGGLSRRSRIILVFLAAIPLMAINAGEGNISLPIFGSINTGLLYPLFLIPLGIVGATTTYNFLAGFNGLEAGQGIIILTSMSVIAFFTGNPWLSVICLSMVSALLGFLVFNYYPAKVFPGDSLTYGIGGLIAIVSILGNFEKIAFLFFTPYILETILKSRGSLKKQSFGLPKKGNYLDMKYEKIYGLTHLSIFLMKKLKIRPTEQLVVISIWAFQILVVILTMLVFSKGIF